MTYIGYLNQFWKVHEEIVFPASAIALYVYLLNECNRRNWRMPFPCSTVVVCQMLRTSKPSLMMARQMLAEVGLISFEEGRSRHTPSKYSLLELTEGLTIGLTDDMTPLYSEDRDDRVSERKKEVPTVADVETYMSGCNVPDGYVLKEGIPQCFCDYYESKGWQVGNTPMTDWRASARKWVKDFKNLIKKGNESGKRNSECERVDNRTEVRNLVEELEQRSLRTANS